MKLLICLTLTALLAACGTPTPFERGPRKENEAPAPPVGETAEGLSEQVYMEKIFPLLESQCSGCHGNPAPDFNAAKSLAVFKQPGNSPILLRPTGTDHETIWAAGSSEAGLVTKWIMGEPVQ